MLECKFNMDHLVPLVTFRGYTIEGEMVIGELHPRLDDKISLVYLYPDFEIVFIEKEVVVESLSIFTGLFFANGDPIFASFGKCKGGDIVSSMKGNLLDGYAEYRYVVEYDAPYIRPFAQTYIDTGAELAGFHCDEWETLGNNYMNPERLIME